MLDGNVFVITGASGRLGAEIVECIYSSGCKVVLVDINSDKLLEQSRNYDKNRILSIDIDTTSVCNIDKIIELTIKKFGKIDGVVHSAYPRSKGWGKRIEEVLEEHLFEDLNKHLGGSVLVAQRFLEYFKMNGRGNLIFVSSIMGVRTPRFENYIGTSMTSPLEYTIIKSAIISMSSYLSKYYKGNNIRVNCISPGGILADQPDAFIKKYNACCNDKGMLTSIDIVGTVKFLLSKESRYITGQNIIIDDGWCL